MSAFDYPGLRKADYKRYLGNDWEKLNMNLYIKIFKILKI